MSVTTTYPNSQQLVSTALTLAQINTLMQQLSLAMLGFTAIIAVTPHAGAAGTNYKVGDQPIVAFAGATGGLLGVLTLGVGGSVATLQPATPNEGKGWLVGSNLPTTGGSGTGLAVDVTMVGTSPTASDVRLEFPTQGAPFGEVNQDVCYISCMTHENEYDKIRYKFIEAGPGDLVTELQNYTRTWRIHWCFYGPNSTDNARMVKSALSQNYFTDQLSLSQLFPVSDYADPVRAPENIDGQFFERVDFEAVMHEFVQESITDQTVTSVEVIGNDNSGTIFDVTIT